MLWWCLYIALLDQIISYLTSGIVWSIINVLSCSLWTAVRWRNNPSFTEKHYFRRRGRVKELKCVSDSDLFHPVCRAQRWAAFWPQPRRACLQPSLASSPPPSFSSPPTAAAGPDGGCRGYAGARRAAWPIGAPQRWPSLPLYRCRPPSARSARRSPAPGTAPSYSVAGQTFGKRPRAQQCGGERGKGPRAEKEQARKKGTMHKRKIWRK